MQLSQYHLSGPQLPGLPGQTGKPEGRIQIAFRVMFWDVCNDLLIKVMHFLSGEVEVFLNAIWFNAAFRHISFGCMSCEAAGRQKLRASVMCLNG